MSSSNQQSRVRLGANVAIVGLFTISTTRPKPQVELLLRPDGVVLPGDYRWIEATTGAIHVNPTAMYQLSLKITTSLFLDL